MFSEDPGFTTFLLCEDQCSQQQMSMYLGFYLFLFVVSGWALHCFSRRETNRNRRAVQSFYEACVLTDVSCMTPWAQQLFGFWGKEDEISQKLLEAYQDAVFNHMLRIYKDKHQIETHLFQNVYQLETFFIDLYKHDETELFSRSLEIILDHLASG